MSEARGTAPFLAADLHNAVAGKIGLVHVDLPGYVHPVWLRAGTHDAAECANFLQNFIGRLKPVYVPRRILEIGAGAGYRSLALAAAYPGAEILAFEADPACHPAALLNTLPYRNISFHAAAVSDETRYFALDGRAGNALLTAGDGPHQATPLSFHLAARGWDDYDTVIFQPDAVSAPLLTTAWPASVRLVAVFTGGAALPADAVAKFGQAAFTARQDGRYWIMSRGVQAAPEAPAAAPIFDPSGPLNDLALMNVSPEPWGFFPIGAHSFRLHPNRGTGPAARLVLSQYCHNYRHVTARLRHGHPVAAPITFTISITAEPEGTEIFRAQQTVKGGEDQTLTGDLAPYDGPCRVTFATKMASMGSKNDCAWAEFIEPKFA